MRSNVVSLQEQNRTQLGGPGEALGLRNPGELLVPRANSGLKSRLLEAMIEPLARSDKTNLPRGNFTRLNNPS